MKIENEIEEWREVKGFEGIYKISSHGCIQRVSSGKILKDYPNASGYRITVLHGNKKAKTVYTHTLVAESFLGQNMCCPTCGQKQEINHKDRNKGNNHFKNLEYVSRTENMKWIHKIQNKK